MAAENASYFAAENCTFKSGSTRKCVVTDYVLQRRKKPKVAKIEVGSVEGFGLVVPRLGRALCRWKRNVHTLSKHVSRNEAVTVVPFGRLRIRCLNT